MRAIRSNHFIVNIVHALSPEKGNGWIAIQETAKCLQIRELWRKNVSVRVISSYDFSIAKGKQKRGKSIDIRR